MTLPLIFSFWFMVAAYVIHVLDESLLGGSFVEKIRQHWWPEYSWTKFFWFKSSRSAASSRQRCDISLGDWLGLYGLSLCLYIPLVKGRARAC